MTPESAVSGRYCMSFDTLGLRAELLRAVAEQVIEVPDAAVRADASAWRALVAHTRGHIPAQMRPSRQSESS